MWMARNKDGKLHLFTFIKPVRKDEEGCWVNDEHCGDLADSIRLTMYYADYAAHREWFFDMLKHQDHYKDCTDEERDEIWWNHIHKDYDFDEIWYTIQYEGYTIISLKTNRYENQPHHVKVCESKEYIDNILKKYDY